MYAWSYNSTLALSGRSALGSSCQVTYAERIMAGDVTMMRGAAARSERSQRERERESADD